MKKNSFLLSNYFWSESLFIFFFILFENQKQSLRFAPLCFQFSSPSENLRLFCTDKARYEEKEVIKLKTVFSKDTNSVKSPEVQN